MNSDKVLAIVRDVAGSDAPTEVLERDGFWLVTFARTHPGGIPLGAPSYVVLADGRCQAFQPLRQTAADVAATLRSRPTAQ